MAGFTKQAIKASFLKLLNEKPLSQISVRMIVEDCGINRNSFYYHYQDIPALIEEIVKDRVDALVADYPTVESLDECITVVIRELVANRKAVLHIYNSVNRDIYERYLMKISEYIATTYLTTAFGGVVIPPEDLEVTIRFIKCEIFGLSFEWIMNGMKEESMTGIHRIIGVCHGLSDDIIRRIRESNDHP